MAVRASTDGSNELVLVVQLTDDDFDAFVLVVVLVVGGGDSIRGILSIRMMSGVYIRIHVRRRRRRRLNRRRWYFRRHRVSTEHGVRVLVNSFL